MPSIPYPPYISRCSMLYCRSSEILRVCPHYSNGICAAVGADDLRKEFDAHKPPFCRAFFWGGLLELSFEARNTVKPESFYGHLIKSVVGFDLGPGSKWKDAVVKVEWGMQNQFIWISIKENPCYSEPSPLARWFCQRSDLAAVTINKAAGRLSISSASAEEIEIRLGFENIQLLKDSVDSAANFETWWKTAPQELPT